MMQERRRGDEEPGAPGSLPDEGVGPARPIQPAESGDGSSGGTAGSPGGREASPGEYVGRAQPIDPERRAPRSSDSADGPPVAPASPEEDEPPRRVPPRVPATRPAGGRPPSSRRARAASARGAVDRVRRADFPVVLRGYDRSAVDAYVADVAQLVAELEATQLPETVVQRALDEVGGETSAILKRAHEAGEEITARSRAQAEDRLQRAEREAERTRKEAEDQVRRLEEDVGTIWQERQRLIDDVRALADDVLALADDAMERMSPPAGGRENGGPASEAEPPGAGVAGGEDESFPSGQAEPGAEGLFAGTPGEGGEDDEAEGAETGTPPGQGGAVAGAALGDKGRGGDDEDEGISPEDAPPDQTLSLERPPELAPDEDTAEHHPGETRP